MGAISRVLVLATLLLPAPSGFGDPEISGRVVGVIDGDTLEIIHAGDRPLRVRLAGIDAPEPDQPYGGEARQALSALVNGKVVRVVPVETDDYGRTVAHVYAGGQHINAAMVRDGHAWAYRRYATGTELISLEAEARRAHRGLWALRREQRVPPWKWRQQASSSPTLGIRAPSRSPQGAVVGNRGSGVYHWPGCPGYESVAPKNRVVFPSRQAAEKAGYRPARNCP